MSRYLSWVALLVGLVLWMGVGYFAWMIFARESLRAEREVDLQQASLQHTSDLRLHALARDTKADRTQLENIARVSVLEMLELIEQVGRDAGITVEIGQAISAPYADSQSNAQSVGFIIEGEGSFAEVVHAAALFESLGKPFFIDELQFEMLPGSPRGSKNPAANTWHLIVRIYFISIAGI